MALTLFNPNFHHNNFEVVVFQKYTYCVHPALGHPVVKGLCGSSASSGKRARAKILFFFSEPIRVSGQDGSSLAVGVVFGLSLERESAGLRSDWNCMGSECHTGVSNEEAMLVFGLLRLCF